MEEDSVEVQMKHAMEYLGDYTATFRNKTQGEIEDDWYPYLSIFSLQEVEFFDEQNNPYSFNGFADLNKHLRICLGYKVRMAAVMAIYSELIETKE